ncbi:hypothetical protein RSOLAG1IB_12110 [Rhizoctonia solani AG-1 IB]|uniref:Uncharacterized protein n=1 Tax=Thanatephorus cucumeris (strain AG1-IB / isolate 7/3/14) TaxID=1108050 RepID=A0A0B7FK57_THACB|nr:hypothetical protein RSOLAG1IB_12110 [Rhizoctonia solani AG-1 IB]
MTKMVGGDTAPNGGLYYHSDSTACRRRHRGPCFLWVVDVVFFSEGREAYCALILQHRYGAIGPSTSRVVTAQLVMVPCKSRACSSEPVAQQTGQIQSFAVAYHMTSLAACRCLPVGVFLGVVRGSTLPVLCLC